MRDVLDLLLTGQEAIQESGRVKEAAQRGILRAGNTACQTKEGLVRGKCSALTYLRLKGVEVEAHVPGVWANRLFMFEAGRVNEDSWVEALKAADPELRLLREEEVPISWETPEGVKVTGRPDIVLLDKEGKLEQGIELKLVSSVFTAVEVLIERVPKFDHVCQAAHYMWKLDVPFSIWYTSRMVWHNPPSWKRYPREGETGSVYFKYKSDGSVLTIEPFVQGFNLRLNKFQVVEFQDAILEGEWKATAVTIPDIQRYYSSLASMSKAGSTVPKMPVWTGLDGKPKSYPASKYCPLKPLGMCCDKACGKPLDKWVQDVQNKLDAKKTEEG